MTGFTENQRALFTRENSLSIADAKAASKYVGKAAALAQDVNARADFVGVAAAYATHAAIRTGFLGGPDGMQRQEYAAMFGKSNGTVTLWARLGQAFVDLSIDPDSDLGRVLRVKGGDKVVGDALKADGATAESVRDALAGVFKVASDGTLTTEKVTPSGGNTGNVAPASETSEQAMPRNNDGRITLVEKVLATLSGSMTAGEKKRLAEILDAVAEAHRLPVTYGDAPSQESIAS